ncbi:MAG: hypothetical protein WBC06_00560 [Chitinophagaceae bacterium]
MQFLKTSLTMLTAAFLLTACGNNEKKEKTEAEIKEEILSTDLTDEKKESGTATKLDGAWEIIRAEGSMAETNVGTVYDFNGNKLAFGKGGFNNPGKTEVTDSTFSFQADGNEYKFMYNYKFDGDTLVVEMQKSGGQIFHMIKK